MGIAQRFERKLQAAIGDAFARVFGGGVVPQEVEAALHQLTVWTDVEAPSSEIPHLILPFADDQADDRLLYPRRLMAQAFTFLGESSQCHLVIGGGEFGLFERSGSLYLG